MLLYNDNDLSQEQRQQTPIEDYDDVVAYDVDDEFIGCKLGTNKLGEINLLFISEEIGAEPFELILSDGRQKIDFDEYSSIIDLLCQISGLYVVQEAREDHPAGSVTHYVLIENASKTNDIESDINLLATALLSLQEKAENK
ncbi:MAG: hypothetical protein ABJH20_04665, partial [Rhizobiaceae bacterium]